MPLELYEMPRPGAVYCYGMDPAKGGGDYSTLCIMDPQAEPIREVALFRSNLAGYATVATLARELHDYGYTVARGRIPTGLLPGVSGGLVPEGNEQNGALLNELHHLFTGEYWFRHERPLDPRHPEGVQAHFGWYNSTSGKKMLLQSGVEAIASHALQVYNPYLEKEARHWHFTQDRWSYGLELGTDPLSGHGDTTIAVFLAYQGCLAVRETLARRAARALRKPVQSVVYFNWSGASAGAQPRRRANVA